MVNCKHIVMAMLAKVTITIVKIKSKLIIYKNLTITKSTKLDEVNDYP